MTPVKDGRAEFILDHLEIGTPAVGFYSGGEKLGSNPNTALASENLARARVGGHWMEYYYEETAGGTG